MQKINVIEYLPKIMTELEKGVLINTKNGDKLNTMTIAWGQIGIEWNKFVLKFISLKKKQMIWV